MAIGVDTSKWKPRKMNGTPAAIIRNRIAYGVIGIGTAFGLFFHFSNITLNLRNKLDVLYTDPQEEVERKQIIAASLPVKTGDMIRRQIEQEKNPAQPHK